MRLLLSKNLVESYVGGLISRFQVKRRRSVLFFDDIIADYARYCEDSGHWNMMLSAAEEAGVLMARLFIPGYMKTMPPSMVFNGPGKLIWKRTGLLSDIDFSIKDGTVRIETKDEAISDVIGCNSIAAGSWMGAASFLMGKRLALESISYKEPNSEYVFRVTHDPPRVPHSKPKERYDALNSYRMEEGFSLKDAISAGVIRTDGDLMYFRGRRLFYSENTLFHLLSKCPDIGRVSVISARFFDDIIDAEATDKEKLRLMKTLLQSMGWGITNSIMKENGDVRVVLESPPVGLQVAENYKFLVNTIHGYMMAVDERFVLRDSVYAGRKLTMDFRRTGRTR